ncbi:MAG: sulfatase-like hydrolase/transferase [bacterium]|nr:sulfatase-like hydrolase/transferase [bacterium]
MKKMFRNLYFQVYMILLFNLSMVEIIFKLIAGFDIFDVAMIRIFLGLNMLVSMITYLLSLANSWVRKMIVSLLVFLAGLYACLQAGFYNFLGVYMSFQTSSQLEAVTDYVKDFLSSFNGTYFLTFIPLGLVLIWMVFGSKQFHESIHKRKALLISIILFTISTTGYSFTILSDHFQNKFQPISNKELFLTVNNPSLAINQYGTIGFCLLDVKAMLFPVVVMETSQVEEEEMFSNREVDDMAWQVLIETETNDILNDLNRYFIHRSIAKANEYTGLFEGKNLIVIMMESTNDIFINEEYYPNFYKLVSEGWYWENNYSPRNSCATMNNEFSGMTSLYSIYNTCTASTFKNNTYYQSIFERFHSSDYVTFSAHNYTEAYYPRNDIHMNMGSGEYFGVEKLGIPYSDEYKDWSNDDEFLGKVLEIIDEKTENNERFMTWLTTVSAHQPYTQGSSQGDQYYDMTNDTNYPNDIRRYMSKLKILDNGLGILLEGLEERGILDDTVIVLYGDHYPYGISTDHLNTVLDYDTGKDLNAERVPFVIYNSKIGSRVFSEYTSYINILPTLANLFGLDYDSRLYLGSDLLSSDYESLVVFADGSWKNEDAYYHASKGSIQYYTDRRMSDEEIKKLNDSIQNKIAISNSAIKNNYFEYLNEALTRMEKDIENEDKNMCIDKETELYLEENNS